jgi:hypothetical protein
MNFEWDAVSQDAVFIIGAGRFGSRAARILSGRDSRVFIVDLNAERFSLLRALPVRPIVYDGVRFLVENFDKFQENNLIVPSVPLHLAYEWLRLSIQGKRKMVKTSVPEEIVHTLPHHWPASEGSLLVSYADFACPDDCPEPEFCTVTGEKRSEPLYEILGNLAHPEFHTHLIRSRQLAPGLGGYRVKDLKEMANTILACKKGSFFLSTACKCHGILTAFTFE